MVEVRNRKQETLVNGYWANQQLPGNECMSE